MTNNPPFHVGQRVVCVDDSGYGFYSIPPKQNGLKKGKTYLVSSLGKGHCSSTVGVGIKTSSGGYAMCKCGVRYKTNSLEVQFSVHRFAPIEPRHQDVEIAEELLKEPVPETLDKLKPVLS